MSCIKKRGKTTMTKLFLAILFSLALPTSFTSAQADPPISPVQRGALVILVTCVQTDPAQPSRPTNVDVTDKGLGDLEACQGDDATCARCLTSIYAEARTPTAQQTITPVLTCFKNASGETVCVYVFVISH
jgi:hypothetical protein